MENLCTSCLCSDRKLYILSETGFEHLYTQIVNEIAVYNISELCVRICWECKALLRKVGNFKEQVKTCYMELLKYIQRNTVKQLANLSRLQIHQNATISYPQVIVKEDIEEYSFVDDDNPYVDDGVCTKNDDMKAEETHYEPETFVNDLNMDEIMRRDSKRRRDKFTNNDFSKLRNQTETYAQVLVKEELKDCSFENDDTPYIDDDTPYVDDDTSYVDNDMCSRNNDMKEETHCEPEAFVNDLKIDKIKKKKTGKNGDKFTRNKIKITKRKDGKKFKLKNIPTDISQNENRSVDFTIDCNKDEKIVKENNTKSIVMKKYAIDKLKTKNCKITNDVPKMMNETLNEKPICVECGKTFSSRKTYRYHLNVLHKGQNRYPCPRCGKVYQWKSNLGRHMRTHKARDSDELYCELCDKRFASVATFRQHLRISRKHVSESEFSFMCNDCGKKFVSKTRLRDHIDWEHLKKIKFKCQLCNKPFKCHTSLYVHMQNVHRSKDKKDNLCHVCGKSYQNAAKLKYHIVAMHTSETPYQCQQCNAAFGWYSSLYRHVREVHYKLKVQPKKSKKQKKSEVLPSLLPVLPQIHHSGPV